jgi:hypothetical protein
VLQAHRLGWRHGDSGFGGFGIGSEKIKYATTPEAERKPAMKLRAKPDRTVAVIATGLSAGGPLGAARSRLLD